MSVFVTHTPLSQMRPLGTEGERSFTRVMALIERNLSPRHAAVFADPVPVRDGSGIDWYTNADGEVLPLAQLPPRDADAVRRELAAILSDLRETADRLEAEGGGKQHRTALALRSAATFPGETAIFAVRTDEGLAPLVVAWSFESHDPTVAQAFSVSTFGPVRSPSSPSPRPVTETAGGPAIPPTSPAVPPQAAPSAGHAASTSAAGRGGSGWLLPLLPALASLLMLAAIAALLLPACGLRTPLGTISFGFPGSYGCSSLVASVLAPDLAEGRALEHELAVLQQDYQRQRLACLIEAAPLPAPAPAPAPVLPVAPPLAAPPAAVPEDPRFEQRVDERGEAQITLIWEGPDDLDLWLQCPDQRYINYQSKQGCNGTLDIDQNAGNNISPSPVENITFPAGLAQPGIHRIGVQLYGSKSRQFPVPFQVRIRDGAGSRVLNGQLNREGEMVLVDEMRN